MRVIWIFSLLMLMGLHSHAAIVQYVQEARDVSTGEVIAVFSAGDQVETAKVYATVDAPRMINGFHLIRWTVDAEPDLVVRDEWGMPLTSISFTIYEDTLAIAHYLPELWDGDIDGIQDWREWEWFGGLGQTSETDADGDGVSNGQEIAAGTHPAFANTISEGSLGMFVSPVVGFDTRSYVGYSIRREPGGVELAGRVLPGTVVTTPDRSSDPEFGYWSIDGVAQRDEWGRPLGVVSFAVNSSGREATAHYFEGDSDGDGLADALEMAYWGTLAHTGGSDVDGDGRTWDEESAAGTSPHFANTTSEGSLGMFLSPVVAFDTRSYVDYSILREPGGLQLAGRVLPGTVVTTPDRSWDPGFGYWSIDGVAQRDEWGRPLGVVSFPVNSSGMEATAHYFEGDSDGDGLADALEMAYWDTLAHTGGSDVDGDGRTWDEESAAGTSPHFANTTSEGSLGMFLSPVVGFDTRSYVGYSIRREPGGVELAGRVLPGTVVTTPDRSSDPGFGYWSIDGVAQRDEWGRPLGVVSFAVNSSGMEATAHYFEGDSDGDGLADALEMAYWGTLAHTGGSDVDGDGRTWDEESAAGTSPHFANTTSEGSLGMFLSPVVGFDTRSYVGYSIRREPGGVELAGRVLPGTVVTTPDRSSDPGFGYWSIDGVAQRDEWGRPLGVVSFAVNSSGIEATAHYFEGDSDGDGLADALEMAYWGTLAHTGGSDVDGDGRTWDEESAAGTSPHFANTTSEGSLGMFLSPTLVYRVPIDPQRFAADLLTGFDGKGFFTDPQSKTLGAFALPTGFSSPACGDLDGDGDMDLIVGGKAVLRLVINAGTSFSPDLSASGVDLPDLENLPSDLIYPALADWSGDGRADLVVGSDDGVLRFYVSQPGKEISLKWSGSLTVGTSGVVPAFMPVVGGYDLLVLDVSSGFVSQYVYQAGGFPYSTSAVCTSNLLQRRVPQGTALAAVDANRDHVIDIVISDAQGRIWRFLGQADGTFFLESKVWGGSYNGFRPGLTASVVDLDGDGDPDIIGGGTDGALIYLKNPEKHLRVTPAVVTVGTGETLDFSSIDDNGTLGWSMGPSQSGGNIAPLTGIYTAGGAPGIDQVVVRNSAGRTGVAWVNVVQRGGSNGLKWRGLLVDGRRGPNDPVWPAAHALNVRAREVLTYRGLGGSDIRWLGHGGDGPDAPPSRAALQSALRDGGTLANDTEVFVVYLVDHGRKAPNGDGLFLLSENESVSGPELDGWLDTLQASRPNLSVIVVVESCYGGRVAGPMMAADGYSARRLVLTSSGADQLAHLAAGGLVSYSTMWWSGVAAGKSLGQAHEDAVAAMAGLQVPQSGNGGALLATAKLGLDQVAASGRPSVTAIGGDLSLQGTQEARIRASVQSAFALDKVWGVIVPPGYQPGGEDPVVDLPEVELAWDSSAGEWCADAGGFSEGGAPYSVLLQARDVWGQVSPPTILHVSQATVRNRVIIFSPGEDSWAGAAVAGSLAEYARESALLRKVRSQDIKIMADAATGVDATAEASASSLNEAIGSWANADGQLAALTVFLVGQGSQEGLVCANGDTVSPVDLRDWLDALQDQSGAVVQVIVDADYSGAFVREAGNSNHRRILLSSTGASQRNTFASGRWSNVTRWIWNSIARGRDLRESYADASDLARMIGGTVPALFDDNGDGMFTRLNDGLKAINAFVGSAYVTADDPPSIGRASAMMRVAAGQRARFWVSNIVMPDGNAPDSVWGEVVGPDGGSRGTMQLWRNLAKDRYEGSFAGFTEAGNYLIFVQAGTPGNPAKTTPPAVVRVEYDGSANTGGPATGSLPVLALPTNGQAMDVETETGDQWRLTLTRGQRVVIEARDVTPRRDVALRLIGADDQILADADQWGAGFGEAIKGWEAPADGSYLVRASFAAGNGAASCRVRAYISCEAGAADLSVLPSQSIAFNPPSTFAKDSGSIELTATATSGLPVRFEMVSGPANIVGTMLTPTGAGTVVLRACQDGDANWDSAEPVERTMVLTSGGIGTYESWAQALFGADYAAKGGPAQDADADGQTNKAEWLARTDPRNGADRFEVFSTTRDGSGFKLRWLAREGVSYRVTRSSDLKTWTELPDSRVTGSGSQAEAADSAPPQGRALYRVEVIHP